VLVNTGEKHVPFPNKDQQWKPGESGNPAGKPKGARHWSTIVQELLNVETELLIQKGPYDFATEMGIPAEVITRTMIRKAVAGDVKAAAWLKDTGYGAKVDVTSNGKKLEGLVIIRNDDKA